MKKNELTRLLDDARQELADVQQNNRELQSRLANSVSNEEFQKCMEAVDQKAYNLWKANNEKYAKRFFKEYLSRNLSVDVDTDYAGYVSVKILLEGQVISEQDASITIHHNPLDE